MDPMLIGILSVPFLLLLLVLRVHVGIALYSTGFLGYWLMTGNLEQAIRILATQPFAVTASFTMSVLPLFMIMGVFAGLCGFASDAYDAGAAWLGKMRGGLSISTVVANALFGAACGSTVAAIAIFAKFSLPEMKKQGYNPTFATASIASAGALAMLIPPSVLMIFYGILTEQSIGRIFIAGIGPGILLAALLSLGIYVMARLRPSLAPPSTMNINWRTRIFSLRKVWGIVILVMIVLGGIYSGVFTPEEAGAVGAFAALVIALILRRINRKTIRSTLRDAAQINATIFILYSGATLYSRLVALSGLPNLLGEWVETASVSPMLILAILMLVYLALGCIMDSISMMTLTLPIVFPISQVLGWDPLWFAVVIIIIMEVGLLTPPVGLSVFVAKAVAGPDVTLEGLFRAVIPFFFITLAALALVIVFPQIATWIPGLMLGK